MNINLCLKHGFSLDAIYFATISNCLHDFSMSRGRKFKVYGTNLFNQFKQLSELGHKDAQWMFYIFSQNPHIDYLSVAFLSSEETGRSFYYASRFACNAEFQKECLKRSAQLKFPHAIVLHAIQSGIVNELIERIDTVTIHPSHMAILFARYFPTDELVLTFLQQKAAKEGHLAAMVCLVTDAFDRKQYAQCMQWAFNAAIFGYSDVISTISNVLSEGHEYLVGKYMWLGMRETYFFTDVLSSDEKETLQQAESQFIAQKTAAQRSVFTWMWLSRLWGIPRDVALIIARKTWAARNAPLH